VLVVAHGNTIRAIASSIDGLSEDEICDMEVPPCIPLVYRFARKSALDEAFMAAEGAAEGLLAPDGAVGSLKPFAGVASSLRARFHHARQRLGGG